MPFDILLGQRSCIFEEPLAIALTNLLQKSALEVPETHDLPQHVAVIMDGNGRWAKKRFCPVLPDTSVDWSLSASSSKPVCVSKSSI